MDSGLTTDQAEKNAEKWGTNLYKKKKTKSFFQLLLEALNNQILIILIIAAILDIVI
jgi:magnesium-transporting ATPase (P-type)